MPSKAALTVIANLQKLGASSSCFTVTGDPKHFAGINNTSFNGVQTSGYMAPYKAGGETTLVAEPLTQTITTTQNTAGDTIEYTSIYLPTDTTNGGTWFGPNLGGNQTVPVPFMPAYGDPTPGFVGGFPGIGQYPPIKIVPNLEDLEEGVHDIPGGKIIIKKIKVTEDQLDAAMFDALGHEATPEEKTAILQEIAELAASEEREI